MSRSRVTKYAGLGSAPDNRKGERRSPTDTGGTGEGGISDPYVHQYTSVSDRTDESVYGVILAA